MSNEESTRINHVKLAQQLSTQYLHTAVGYDKLERLEHIQAMLYYPELQNASGNCINPEMLPGRIDPRQYNNSLSMVHAISANTFLWDNVAEVENLPTTANPTQVNEQWVSVPVSPSVYANLAGQVRAILQGRPAAQGTATKTASDPQVQIVAGSRSQIDNQAASGSNFFSWMKGLLNNG